MANHNRFPQGSRFLHWLITIFLHEEVEPTPNAFCPSLCYEVRACAYSSPQSSSTWTHQYTIVTLLIKDQPLALVGPREPTKSGTTAMNLCSGTYTFLKLTLRLLVGQGTRLSSHSTGQYLITSWRPVCLTFSLDFQTGPHLTYIA